MQVKPTNPALLVMHGQPGKQITCTPRSTCPAAALSAAAWTVYSVKQTVSSDKQFEGQPTRLDILTTVNAVKQPSRRGVALQLVLALKDYQRLQSLGNHRGPSQHSLQLDRLFSQPTKAPFAFRSAPLLQPHAAVVFGHTKTSFLPVLTCKIIPAAPHLLC